MTGSLVAAIKTHPRPKTIHLGFQLFWPSGLDPGAGSPDVAANDAKLFAGFAICPNI
jgi:hypothetical protein